MKRWKPANLILGALLGLVTQYLFLKTHGPYEEALNQIVWGLNHHDYSRWAIFPALMILPGIRAFHNVWQDSYGRGGLWGFRLFFSGLMLGTAGQIWDYVLFDPWGHPMHGIGFVTQLLAILMIVLGMPLWAGATYRARTLSGWQYAIPVLWVLYIIGLCAHIFTSDETWLYPRFGIDAGFLASTLISIAYVLMGLILWNKGEFA